MIRKYARFQADPQEIRVGIRRDGSGWLVTVAPRTRQPQYTWVAHAWAQTPKQAVEQALRKAEDEGFRGIDRDLQWTYEHPQYVGK